MTTLPNLKARLRELCKSWHDAASKDSSLSGEESDMLFECAKELGSAIVGIDALDSKDEVSESALERAVRAYDAEMCEADTWEMLSPLERELKYKWMRAALAAAKGVNHG